MSPSLSIVFGLSSKTQWLSGLYYADFISFFSPTQLCGGGTTKSNSNELPISVPLSFYVSIAFPHDLGLTLLLSQGPALSHKLKEKIILYSTIQGNADPVLLIHMISRIEMGSF